MWIVFLTSTTQQRSNAKRIISSISAKILPVMTPSTQGCFCAARHSSTGSNQQKETGAVRCRMVCANLRAIYIGKDLARYDALDTGMFLCSPALFDRLESAKRDGSCSLSDGMRQLAREQKLRAFDIGDAHWQDVDSPEALAHAESIFDVDFPENPLAESLVDA